jgi:DNA repair protein RadC
MKKLYDGLEELIKNYSLDKVSEVIAEKMKKELTGLNVLSNPDEVIKYARVKIGSEKNECFMLILLNVKNEVLESEIMTEGTIHQAIIYPRTIVKKCLDINSAGLIMVHNHPSGHHFPSEADTAITAKIKNVLAPIDIKLLDHIIITSNDYYSFQEEGKV